MIAITPDDPALAALARMISEQVARDLDSRAAGPQLVSLGRVAEMLDCAKETARALLESRGLPVQYLSSRNPRWVRADVIALIEEGRKP